MTFAMTCMLALGLSMDAFAAALAKGAALQRPSVPDALRVGAAFGFFEFATPMLGWALGLGFSSWIAAVDHWVAFVLLGVVGAGMVRQAVVGEDGGQDDGRRRLGWCALAAAAVATSLDATAVGVTLAFMDVPIVVTAMVIGMVSFGMALGGVYLGRVAGPVIGRRAEAIGGIVLIAIGIKILVEHTMM
jgi:manganese efflux pump family protein